MVLYISVYLLGAQVFAAETASQAVSESEDLIVFLVDTSGSMENSDPGAQRIRESLAMANNILPKETELAVITYSDQVNIVTPIYSSNQQELHSEIEKITYRGNTNLSAGLDQAVSLMGGSSAKNKKIVVITDGELFIGRDASESVVSTAQALLDEKVAKSKADKIVIDTLVLTEHFDGDPENVRVLSSETGGTTRDIVQAVGLTNAIEDLCLPYYKNNLYSVRSFDSIDDVQQVDIEIPTQFISEVRILFSTYTPVTGVAFQSHQENLHTISNPIYTMLSINDVSKETLSVRFSSVDGGTVKVYYMISYNTHSVSKVEIETDVRNEKQNAILFVDVIDNDTGKSILSTGNFGSFVSNVEVKNTGTGEVYETQGEIKNGKITLPLPNGWLGDCTADATLESENIRISAGSSKFDISDKLTAALKAYRQRIMLIVFGIIFLLIAAIVFILAMMRRRPVPMVTDQPVLETAFSFAGKLDAYVTSLHDRDDTEIAPFSFYLHSVIKEKRVSLQDVLDECGVRYPFGGAGKLILSPGPDKTLFVKNLGSNTVLLRGAIMHKGKSYRVSFGEKMFFTADDGLSEIAVYYRNVKGREREVYRAAAIESYGAV